jgi:hypothetical protein
MGFSSTDRVTIESFKIHANPVIRVQSTQPRVGEYARGTHMLNKTFSKHLGNIVRQYTAPAMKFGESHLSLHISRNQLQSV